MNDNDQNPQAQPPLTLENIDARVEEIRSGSKTIGEYVGRIFEDVLVPTGAHYPLMRDERFRRRVLRCVEPWPVWVLRIATEVLAVRFPSIPKETILSALRLLHYLALELRRDGTNKGDLPPVPDLDDKIMGAIAGHVAAHVMRHETEMQLHPSDAEGVKQPSLADLEKDFVPMIAEHFFAFPLGFLDFNAALTEAKATTFDKAGNLKETPLAPVYRKILADWTEVECFSGPKELTQHLSQLLGNQDFEDKYERVKKICQRFEIIFKPVVKGQ